MSNVTTLRAAVTAKLQTDLGIRFVPGQLEGPSPNEDLGCVYPVRSDPWASDVNIQTVILVVRVFRRAVSSRPAAPEVPLDPTALEDVASQILLSLQPVQASQAIQLGYFQWEGTEFAHDSQGVEVRFRSWAPGEFASGG